MAGLPEYGGLGGMGGPRNLPTESENDGALSLTLSRLQLLGVGLTYAHRNITSHIITGTQHNTKNTVETHILMTRWML